MLTKYKNVEYVRVDHHLNSKISNDANNKECGMYREFIIRIKRLQYE